MFKLVYWHPQRATQQSEERVYSWEDVTFRFPYITYVCGYECQVFKLVKNEWVRWRSPKRTTPPT